MHVMQTPGVRAVVGFGGKPAPVAASEIDTLQAALVSGCGVQPWPYLTAGNRVRLEDGPLAGVEGILLREKSQFRVVVSVALLQRSVAVEIGRESVVAVKTTSRSGPYAESGH
jgi:transcription antitermination factor NusG